MAEPTLPPREQEKALVGVERHGSLVTTERSAEEVGAPVPGGDWVKTSRTASASSQAPSATEPPRRASLELRRLGSGATSGRVSRAPSVSRTASRASRLSRACS